MNAETKQIIQFHLGMLTQTLADSNTAIGVMIDKKDANKSQLAFISYESYQQGNVQDGFTVSFEELNKKLFEK